MKYTKYLFKEFLKFVKNFEESTIIKAKNSGFDNLTTHQTAKTGFTAPKEKV